MARRAAYGIFACGGTAGNESGDLFLAFSTANREAAETHAGVVVARLLGEEAMSRIYEATIHAVEEAIMNSLLAAETTTGRDGLTAPGSPVADVRDIVRKYNRLAE